MKIALFDSGINDKRSEIQKERIQHINTSLYVKNSEDNIGHGTAIAYILQKCVKDAIILSYKLFDSDYMTSEEDIIYALWDIYENKVDVQLVNISSGATYVSEYDRFYEICDKLSRRGCIIVAAYDNEGSISYPAAFDNTIGVFWDANVRSVREYFYVENSQLEILGYAGNQRLPWINEEYKYVGGSSFATPYITARIAEYQRLVHDVTLLELKELLRQDATDVITLPQLNAKSEQREKVNDVLKIKKSIIFPFNKETHAIIANTDLINFEIVGVYDYKFSSKLGRLTDSLVYGEAVVKLSIEKFEDIDWEGDFDTIIVGHVQVINNMMKTDYIETILEKCSAYQKNCFFFDDIRPYKVQIEKVKECGKNVMNHYIQNFHIANFPCGSYHKIALPTMAVVGTSPHQGKYNVQLSLRRRFIEDGYAIGQVGTEPSAHLLGMDITLSNGYDNQYADTGLKEMLYINEEIFQLRNKDIILLGTQSQLIPMQFGNLGFLTPHQHNMLIALEPDCTILCVNCDDDELYIKRTLNVLENYYMTTVIAIVIFPFYRDRNWNVNNQLGSRIEKGQEEIIKKEFCEKYGVHSFVNGNKHDMDELYNTCISFFSND